jgi:hypothetical protein
MQNIRKAFYFLLRFEYKEKMGNYDKNELEKNKILQTKLNVSNK